MTATHNRTGQRLTVLGKAENGYDLVVANKNGKRLHVPANLITTHGA